MPRESPDLSRVSVNGVVYQGKGADQEEKVDYGEPCPCCGSATQIRVQCKLFCAGCKVLLSNCNGD